MTRSRDVSAVQNNLGVAIPPAAAGKNAVINGGFDIWQRGTSFAGTFSTGTTYTADRWVGYRSGAAVMTISQQTSGLTGFKYACRVQRDSGNTATGGINVQTALETINSLQFANQTVTLSFYARAGSNYSSSANALNAYIYSGTGTDQTGPATGLTGQATVASTTATLTTSWQRFTVSGTVGSTATQLALNFNYTPTGTAGTNDYFEITGVQLELGSSATPFSRAGGNIQGELAACQRYYQRYNLGSTTGANGAVTGYALTASRVDFPVFLPVRMRVAPTVFDYSNLRNYAYRIASDLTGGTYACNIYYTDVVSITYTHGSSALSANDVCVLNSATNAATYFGFSAEL